MANSITTTLNIKRITTFINSAGLLLISISSIVILLPIGANISRISPTFPSNIEYYTASIQIIIVISLLANMKDDTNRLGTFKAIVWIMFLVSISIFYICVVRLFIIEIPGDKPNVTKLVTLGLYCKHSVSEIDVLKDACPFLGAEHLKMHHYDIYAFYERASVVYTEMIILTIWIFCMIGITLFITHTIFVVGNNLSWQQVGRGK